MPAFPYQKALIDIWFDAFPNTTLLMNFDEPQAPHIRNHPRRRVATRLSRRSARQIRQSLLPAGDARYLSATGRSIRHSGRLAKTPGVTGSLRHRF